MRAYYDTGALIKLYVEEAHSEQVTAHAVAQGEPIAVNLFHELEMENALRLKVFRREMTERQCREVLERIIHDVEDGRLARRPVIWPKAFQEARRVSSLAAVRCGCRTLDVLHVGLAIHWGCSVFVSLDDRQIKAASAVHLEIADIRIRI